MRLGRGQSTRFVPHNAKVADINHADTSKHLITLATMGLPLNAVVLILTTGRVSGTGYLRVYGNEGTSYQRCNVAGSTEGVVVGIINERLQYDQSVANDDFDLKVMGYWVAIP